MPDCVSRSWILTVSTGCDYFYHRFWPARSPSVLLFKPCSSLPSFLGSLLFLSWYLHVLFCCIQVYDCCSLPRCLCASLPGHHCILLNAITSFFLCTLPSIVISVFITNKQTDLHDFSVYFIIFNNCENIKLLRYVIYTNSVYYQKKMSKNCV